MSTVNRIPDIARRMRNPAVYSPFTIEAIHNFRITSIAIPNRLLPQQNTPSIFASMVLIVSSWVNPNTNIVYVGGQELGPAGLSPSGVPVGNGLELEPGRGVIFSVDEFDDQPIRDALGQPHGQPARVRAIDLRGIWHMSPAGNAFVNVVYIERGV